MHDHVMGAIINFHRKSMQGFCVHVVGHYLLHHRCDRPHLHHLLGANREPHREAGNQPEVVPSSRTRLEKKHCGRNQESEVSNNNNCFVNCNC